MDRAELERLDRESLVLRAQAAGIRRARVLTRPELIDELLRLDPALDAAQLRRTRGFFGRARDLLSRVVERGLHLPDAADRLRAALVAPPNVPRPEPQAVPTVTLAEIYAAQGHKQRALETLRRVLETEPEHSAARALLVRLEASDYVPPPPPLPPEPDEIPQEIGANLGADGADAAPSAPDEASVVGGAAAEPAPLAESAPPPTPPEPVLDQCVAIPLDRTTSFVWWRLSASTKDRLFGAPFVVRAVLFMPTWDGPEQAVRDIPADPDGGELVLRELPRRAVVRVAVGYEDDGAFVPIAHSVALEPSASGPVCWTLDGTFALPHDGPEADAIARAGAAARELVGVDPASLRDLERTSARGREASDSSRHQTDA